MSESIQTTPDNSPTITISDLQNVLVLIDLASNRGTFRGAELSSVGSLYERIQAFVQAISPLDDAASNNVTNPAQE